MATNKGERKRSVGETIAALRKERGWTQAELAQKLNLTDKAVSKWEQDGGTPNLDSIFTLADIFGVSIDYLLRGETPEIDWNDILTIENACKNDLPVLIDRIRTEILLGKDERGLTVLDYALKYKCKNVVKAFFKRFPVDKIFQGVFHLTEFRGWAIDFYECSRPQVVRVLVEYLMIDELNKINAFFRNLEPNRLLSDRRKKYEEILNENINLYTDEYFGRILIDGKFKGKFYDTYLGYFGEYQYRNALAFALKEKNDALFRLLWKRVMDIDKAYHSAKRKADREGVAFKICYAPFTVVNGELHKNEYFSIGFSVELLDLMLDCGYVDEARELNELCKKFYFETPIPEDKIELAELRKSGKGDTYEALRLSLLEEGLLSLDKLSAINDYGVAKKLLFEECVHPFELLCKLLKNNRDRELKHFCRSFNCSKELLKEISVPCPDRERIKKFAASCLKHGVNEKYFMRKDRKTGRVSFISAPDEEEIRLVKEEYFKPFEEVMKRQKTRQTIAKKFPRSHFIKLLSEGDLKIAVIDLCVLLEYLLNTEYGCEGDLAESISKYCEAKKVDDKTRNLLHGLRMLRNSYVHADAESAKLTKSELAECVDYICNMGEQNG